MIRPRIPGGFPGKLIVITMLIVLAVHVSAQENPINVTNLFQSSPINIPVSLTQTENETPSPAPVQALNRETTATPPVLPAVITITPAIPSMAVPTTLTTYAVLPATTEISPVITTIPITTVSNQNSVQGSNPGATNSLYFSPNDSIRQGPVYEIKTDVVTDSRTGQKYAKDRVIVRFKSTTNAISSVSDEKIRQAHAKVGAKVKKDFSAGGITGLQLVQLPNGTEVQSAIREYQSNPDVLYAEPDYVVSIPPDQTGPVVQDTNPSHILAIPSDGFFSYLWGLHNTGQTGGTPDADIDAPEAWDISTGSGSVVVAVIDTGVLYSHSDLASNIWNNTGEIPDNGIDDDGNGYVDDIRGWDFANNDNDPTDDHSHGTHVSGTIGAVGNNGIGVAGINWQVKIMPLKAFNSAGSGFLSAEIDAIEYANKKGAVVISNSWGGGSFSQSLKDVIDESPAVVVCAAGNSATDNDATPFYPAGYSSPNIIAVAASDHNDALASFSNFGSGSVDLAAPGSSILSTTNATGTYIYKSGTSMATPHVSGVAALVKAVNQSLSSAETITIILSTVDAKSSLSGKVATGGRLNAYQAVLATPPAAPVADFSGVPTSGTAPLPVSFTDLSLNNPKGWAWYFGDETYTAPWTEMNASAGWAGRYGHSSVAMPDGSIVLMGGYGGGIKNDVWRSPDHGATWTQVNASAGWTGRVYHSSVAMPDGSIILTGGFGIGGYKNDTWHSTDNGATWTQMNASAGWSARQYHSSVAMPDGSLVLMGGTDNYTYSYLNDVWRSTDSGASWTQVNANAGWSSRFLQSSVAMPDGSIILMGGFGSDGYKNDVWRSTDNGASWIQLNASAGWTKRWDHKSVAMTDGSIVLIGGVDGSAYKNDSWRFQPAGSSAQNPSHTYTAPGTYPVTLQAYNAAGYNNTQKSGYITVTGSPLPVADFTGTPREGTAPLTVVFTDLSAGGPSSWIWSFGDGSTTNSTVKNPIHTYLTAGNFTVSLNATNSGGSDTKTSASYITVNTRTPIADFSGVPTSGAVPLPVSFTDQSLNDPTGWAWYFGDETYTAPWTEMNASPGWVARMFHSSVAMPDGSIVLMGGLLLHEIRNDTWRSTDNGATWTEMNASPGWSARYGHSSVVMPDASIVLMGGCYSDGPCRNDTWRSMDNGATWTQVNASVGWSARGIHSSVAMPDGSIVLMGGFDGSPFIKNDVWRSTDYGATWTLVNASPGWSARRGHSSVAMPDGSIVLMGGESEPPQSLINDTWRSTDNGATWTQENVSAGWTGRDYHSSVAMPDGSIVLMGGWDSGFKPVNDTWLSTNNGATWTQVNVSSGWNARYTHSSVVMPDGSIVLMGGAEYSAGSYKNDVWRFHPAGSSAQNPLHTYTAPGTYPVALQAFNAVGYNNTQKTGYITVTGSSLPVVDFTGTPREGTAPLTVVFMDLSAGGPSSWNWSFGDGNTTNSTVQNPVHTYRRAGTYTVSLNVTNAGGFNNATRLGYINVTNATPRIGVVRNNNTWLLDASGNGVYGPGDLTYTYGKAGDVYVTGDWTGNGTTKIGVVRNNNTWLLDASGNGLYGPGDLTYTFGKAGDVYITGDWNGDVKTEIGVVRTNNSWILDTSGNGAYGAGDRIYTFGKAGDRYVTGDWTGNVTTKIGVVRNNNTWLLDASGNGAWGAGDLSYIFGKAGDKYVTGKWS